MVEYLSEKFKLKECPTHYNKEIVMEDLEVAGVKARFTTFKTIPECDSFQVVIFTPNSKTIMAANRLFLCEQCRVEYGSCDLFTIYTPVIQQLNKLSLRSSKEEPVLPDSDESTIVTDLLTENGVVVAADSKSIDNIWFI